MMITAAPHAQFQFVVSVHNTSVEANGLSRLKIEPLILFTEVKVYEARLQYASMGLKGVENPRVQILTESLMDSFVF